MTPRWADLRSTLSFGPHLSDGWIAYRDSLGMVPLYLLITSSENEPIALGVVYRVRPRFRPWLAAKYILDRAPWPLVESATPDQVAQEVVHALRSKKCKELEWHSFEGPCPAADLQKLGMKTSHRYEFVLNLESSEDELLANAKSSHRRKLRKAERDGISVTIAKGDDALPTLHSLQAHTQERRAERGEKMAIPQSLQIQRMNEHLLKTESALVFQGHLEGTVVSSILIGLGNDQAYYILGGTNQVGLQKNAASLVMWQAIREVRRRGLRWFNLGGVPRAAADGDAIEHGLYRFKAGWGAVRWDCESGVLPG